MIHRRCRTETDQLREQVARLEAEIRVADRRAGDAQDDAARLRSETESATSRSWDAAGEAELLKNQLDAAQEHERDLEHRIWELECQINDLTEDDSPVAVARTRQTRAITRALAAGEDSRAQALSALPWQAFEPEPELHRPGRWWMDGDEWNIHEIESLLRWRYGLTAVETRDLLQERQAAMWA